MLPHRYTEKTHTISYLIRHRNDFFVDKDYQRDEVWPLRMKQYLIDTVLRGLDISRLWIHVDEHRFYIVDGQQRLNAVWEFAENRFPLSHEFSGSLGGLYYKELPRNTKDIFDEYNVAMVYLVNATDEEIRDIYRRINSGVPLNTAERLNALPGDIVPTMRQLAGHPFFEEVCELGEKKRYRAYHMAAQIMLLQKNGITDVSPKFLFEFFDKEMNLNANSKTYKEIIPVLNYLEQTFDKPTYELGKPGWIITVYLLCSYLLEVYVMRGKESQLKSFFLSFHRLVENSLSMVGDRELLEFFWAISRGTTSTDNISKRHEIIFNRFWQYIKDLTPLDPKRGFTNEERIAIFRKYNGECTKCGIKLQGQAWEAHHKKPWHEGGPTSIENALLLCSKCHSEMG